MKIKITQHYLGFRYGLFIVSVHDLYYYGGGGGNIGLKKKLGKN